MNTIVSMHQKESMHMFDRSSKVIVFAKFIFGELVAEIKSAFKIRKRNDVYIYDIIKHRQ